MAQQTILEYKVEDVPLSKIKLDKTNPNVMTERQMDGLRSFMQKYGFLAPIVVDSKYIMIDGEHRFLIYQGAGKPTIPCIVMINVSTAIERVIVRDGLNQIGGIYDKAKANEIIKKIFESKRLEEYAQYLGKTADEYKRILQKRFGIGGPPEEGDIPPLPVEATTKTGDVVLLGNHKIICGDCTDPAVVNKLLKDKTIDQLLTDPPYGVDYASKNRFLNRVALGYRIEEPILGDDLENYKILFSTFIKNIPFSKKNTIYITISDQKLLELSQALLDNDVKISQYLVWKKNNHVLGRQDYANIHELIIYGWKGTHIFYGQFSTTVLEFNRPNNSDLHPTMKPLDLLRSLIQDGSQKGSNVYDPFLGSGSTLIACEQTGRICYGIEKEPKYCDVTILRWEQYTGLKAKRL